MRWTFVIGALLLLGGCSTRQTVLVNDQGQEAVCETSGGGFLGAMSTYKTQQDCVADAQKRGYRIVRDN